MSTEDFRIGKLPTVESYDTGNAEFDISEQKIHYTEKQQNLLGVDFKDVSIDKYPQYHLAEIGSQINREIIFGNNNNGFNPFHKEDLSRLIYQQQGAANRFWTLG